MKTLSIILSLVLFQTACCKKTGAVEATVNENCTGKYLVIDDKEFLVCNSKKLRGFNDGDKVRVTFEPKNDCKADEGRIRCMMLYEHDGIISVNSVDRCGNN
jgi:hypothetical protein